jgi:hypothetical protein
VTSFSENGISRDDLELLEVFGAGVEKVYAKLWVVDINLLTEFERQRKTSICLRYTMRIRYPVLEATASKVQRMFTVP